MRFTHRFIDRPILATVISVFLTLHRARRAGGAAGRAIPGDRAADGAGDDELPRRIRPGGQPDGRDAARAGDQRRRGHDLHEQPVHRGRQAHHHGHLPHRHGPQRRADAHPEPGAGRAAAAAGRCPAPGRAGAQGDAEHPARGASLSRPTARATTSISRTTRPCT